MSQKVLVVEDDNNIAELLRLYLQKDGFEVSHAADGGKAPAENGDEAGDVTLTASTFKVLSGAHRIVPGCLVREVTIKRSK